MSGENGLIGESLEPRLMTEACGGLCSNNEWGRGWVGLQRWRNEDQLIGWRETGALRKKEEITHDTMLAW